MTGGHGFGRGAAWGPPGLRLCPHVPFVCLEFVEVISLPKNDLLKRLEGEHTPARPPFSLLPAAGGAPRGAFALHPSSFRSDTWRNGRKTAGTHSNGPFGEAYGLKIQAKRSVLSASFVVFFPRSPAYILVLATAPPHLKSRPRPCRGTRRYLSRLSVQSVRWCCAGRGKSKENFTASLRKYKY